MDQKQHAPGTPREYVGAFYRIRHKGRDFVLTSAQYRVFSLLLGGTFTTSEISTELRLSDPRSIIRNLRRMGLSVSDVWERKEDRRYKRYFIHGGDVVC